MATRSAFAFAVPLDRSEMRFSPSGNLNHPVSCRGSCGGPHFCRRLQGVVAHGRANALMLPHVIAYNAAVPMKFLPSPYQKGFVAHKKYATIADLLGLGGATIEEKVNNLVVATEQLLDQLEFPRSIAALGISKEEFARAMPDLTKLAFDDPSWRSNPRMPLMSELAELFWEAYRGRGKAKAARAYQNQAT